MKIAIDNGDGQGAVDFTPALVGEQPIKVERKLNAPSLCAALLCVDGVQFREVRRNARVMLQADNGVVLFTGYVANEPELVPAGAGQGGPVFLTKMSAVSDDVLLDRQPMVVAGGAGSQDASDLMALMTSRTGTPQVAVAAASGVGAVSGFEVDAAQSWSVNAARLATMARASYRVVNGSVSLVKIGTTVHVLDESAGTLNVAALTASRSKMLVNDVTVCGEEEPQAYVAEIFQGDGVTAEFNLWERPFAVRGGRRILLQDQFAGAAANPQLWKVMDPGAFVSVTAQGLTVNGGAGGDGQTTVSSVDAVELGGVLLLELTGVEVKAGSSGYIGCFYHGAPMQQNLCAGFHVQQSGGAMLLSATLMGADIGGGVSMIPGHQYTLRVRTHCRDQQRMLASYYTVDDSGANVFGGDLLAGGLDLVLEMQETTGGLLQKPVVLYDGAVASAPAFCNVVVVNSPALMCSVGSVSLTQEPALWVTMTAPGGSTAATQRLGVATQGANAKVTSGGRLTFFPGNVPASGSQVLVNYRVSGRSVARMANPASIAAESSAWMPGTSRLVCSVTVPPTRSSQDCENAALALLDVASSRAAAWQGSYADINLQVNGDVWPGDVLAVSAASMGFEASVVVRAVEIVCTSGAPELLEYKVQFANDWAEELSLKLSNAIPKEVWLPTTALAGPSALPSLAQLEVAAVTATEVAIQAGQNAPAGGGFEVRRSDWKFGADADADLVLRSPAPNFTIVRESPMEQYFVRMYDGASPPNYSRYSSAVFVNVMM